MGFSWLHVADRDQHTDEAVLSYIKKGPRFNTTVILLCDIERICCSAGHTYPSISYHPEGTQPSALNDTNMVAEMTVMLQHEPDSARATGS